MPREIYQSLSEHAKYIARYVVAEAGEALITGFREDLGTTTAGTERRRLTSEQINESPLIHPEQREACRCQSRSFCAAEMITASRRANCSAAACT